MRHLLLILTFHFLCTIEISAQVPPGNRYHHPDTSKPVLKPEKGPNHGRMYKSNGLKVEMLTPTNTKKQEVSYFVFDTLANPLDAKMFSGTVKYVFGGPNQYLEVVLIPTGAKNQYVATLEDWKDYKQAIVTLKENGKIRSTFVFLNDTREPEIKGNGTMPGRNGARQDGGGMHGKGMR